MNDYENLHLTSFIDSLGEHSNPELLEFAEMTRRKGNIRDIRVFYAMSVIDRKLFVPSDQRENAYRNVSLPLADGSSISQPSLIAESLEHLGLRPGRKALEIGTGSGYNASLMRFLGGPVVTIECDRELVDRARKNIDKTGLKNIEVVLGDGILGYKEEAPYHAITVTAGIKKIPFALINQLANGGVFLGPVGIDPNDLTLTKVIRVEDEFTMIPIKRVRFVPLITAQTSDAGWTLEEFKKFQENPNERPTIKENERDLKFWANLFNMAVEEYRGCILKVFGFNESAPDELIEGLATHWIGVLRMGVKEEHMVEYGEKVPGGMRRVCNLPTTR